MTVYVGNVFCEKNARVCLIVYSVSNAWPRECTRTYVYYVCVHVCVGNGHEGFDSV